MDSEQGNRLFVRGISWNTTKGLLMDYFSAYGDVLSAVVVCDRLTGFSRGFGFVVFAEPSALDRVLQYKHYIDGRIVEVKRALSKEEQQTTTRSKKIFVGGLPSKITAEGLRRHFESYGPVDNAVVIYDQSTLRSRGFGFITFASEDIVDQVLQKTFHYIGGKRVDVKRGLRGDANPNTGGGRSSGAGSYQSYAGANANSGSNGGSVIPPRFRNINRY